jgi:hypothetical protein
MVKKKDLEKRIEQLELDVSRLNGKVEALIFAWPPDKTIPINPYPPQPDAKVTCLACGVIWNGSMSYSCARLDCPFKMGIAY